MAHPPLWRVLAGLWLGLACLLAGASSAQPEQPEPPAARSNSVLVENTAASSGVEPKLGPALLPLGLDPRRVESPWLRGAMIAFATFILEDPTLAAVGLMIREGWLGWPFALGALFVGIFVGDVGLWLAGRIGGRRLLRWKRVAAWVPPERAERFGRWIDAHTGRVVVGCRFVPGTRLPVYVAAGALGQRPWKFVGWTLLAVAVWVPVMTALATAVGGAAAMKLDRLGVPTWLAVLWAFVLVLAGIHFLPRAPLLLTRRGRAGFLASVSKLWRWEFWPGLLFYLPFIPLWCLIALRHGGLTVFAKANPALPAFGGLICESKHALQARFSGPGVLPTALVPPAEAHDESSTNDRLTNLQQAMRTNGWDYPIILKPDVGQRGVGVRLLRNDRDAFDALAASPVAQVLQPYDPGPGEAGVFYVRHPNEPQGRIFSITHKQFPQATGDGARTLQQIIWDDPRLRMQARVFLRRLGPEAAERAPAAGEVVSLGDAGNHAQGSRFSDGSRFITDALTQAVDQVVKRCPGFYFGRLDVRYASEEDFRQGRFEAVEVNGVSSESTHLYDPSFSLFKAYRILWDQWTWAFRIGRHVLQQADAPERKPRGWPIVKLLWRGWFGRPLPQGIAA
ncbi:MAG: DedA family protein [Planctomycetota bacterium]